MDPIKLQKIFHSLIMVGICILFISAIYFGVSAGRKIAYSGYVIQSNAELIKALNFFKLDQDRYPTDVEFSQPQTLGIYLTQYPLYEKAVGVCSNFFRYKQIDRSKFKLEYCLPESGKGKLGWNSNQQN